MSKSENEKETLSEKESKTIITNNTNTENKKNKISNNKIKSTFLIDFFLGGLSGAIGKTSFAPLERAKLLLQTQHTNSSLSIKYTGLFDCLQKLIKNEGFFSLWRGNLINVIRYFPNQALNFALKDTFKNIFPKFDSNKNFYKFFFINCLSGGMAGAISLAILHPIDTIRTRLATDNKKIKEGLGIRKFDGTIDCIRKLYLYENGFKAFYPGLVISVVGMFQYRAIYFGAYDTYKERFMTKKNNFFVNWGVAQIITLSAGCFGYPLDTIKRRMMIQSGEIEKKYKNSRHCFKVMYHEEGIKGYFRGFSANIFRMFGTSLVLVLYDEFKRIGKVSSRAK
jgi:solute carrier family 25 (adenine nucleotide translocator) protein 4/5/6/31